MQQNGWTSTRGGDENPVYRSRLVGKEFNDGVIGGLFAGTPPLEAFRYLVHVAATRGTTDKGKDKVMMINDVSRAFFEAKAKRIVCVELPEAGKTTEERNSG